MAKDPAFLFYYDRFMSATHTMSNEEVGQYIRLMCIQANKGFVTPKDMFHTSLTSDSEVYLKFTEISTGKFVNMVLKDVMEQRKLFTESRRNNRKGKQKTDTQKVKKEKLVKNTSKTSVKHMVNVNVNKDVNVFNKKKELKSEKSGPENNFETSKKNFKLPDINGDQLVFPVDTQPMRDLWAKWKEYRFLAHGADYGKMYSEQSALKLFQGMNFHQIEKTILDAIANKWKNLYPEHQKNGKQQSTNRTRKEQQTADTAEYLRQHYGNMPDSEEI